MAGSYLKLPGSRLIFIEQSVFITILKKTKINADKKYSPFIIWLPKTSTVIQKPRGLLKG